MHHFAQYIYVSTTVDLAIYQLAYLSNTSHADLGEQTTCVDQLINTKTVID